jgi:hypothetical protein
VTLPAVQLDDLQWQQMIDAVRGRIVARSNGKWTMHAAADPGVTLLELFAYQFEQRLYWMDQVPEHTVRALLAMLDDAPAATRAAQTVLSLATLESQPTQTIAAGQRFSSNHLERPQPMTGREDVNVLPVNVDPLSAAPHGFNVSVTAGGRDRTGELKDLRAVELLPADGSAATFHLTLWLDRSFNADEIGGNCHLLLDLETPDRILPEWAPRQTDLAWTSRLPESGYDTSIDPGEIFNACGMRYHAPPGMGADAEPDAIDDAALGTISHQWALARFHVEPPAVLRWTYSTGTGERAFGSADFSDGTVGLRRPGILRIRIPADWQPAWTPPSGPLPYRIFAHTEASDYSTPPVLKQVVPNVVVAQNVQCVKVPWAMLGPAIDGWLRLPAQTLPLRTDGLPPLESAVRLYLREADGEWRRWQPTDHFYRHGPTDRVFVVDRDRRRLTFGNGVTGRIPVLLKNGATARLDYLAGGGEDGNVDEQGWVAEAANNRVLSVVAATGGSDAERASDARARVAAELKRVERAVTAPDYRALALSTPGVAVKRAHAAVGLHPDFPCQHTAGAVTLVIVPEVPRPAKANRSAEDIAIRAPRSDGGEVAAVAARVETRRLLGHEVFVRPVTYRAVRLDVKLDGVVLEEEETKASIERELAAFLDPLIGGAQAEGWPFGEPIRPSTLMRQIKSLLPDGVSVRGVGVALDDEADFETCNEVAIGAHNLVSLAELNVHINRQPATEGGLL